MTVLSRDPVETTASSDLMEEAVDWLVMLRGGNLSESDTNAFADWLLQDVGIGTAPGIYHHHRAWHAGNCCGSGKAEEDRVV